MSRKIYLLRHGRPYMPDGEKRCIGITDIPLSIEGMDQARVLKNWFRKKKIAGIYSSPLKRCVQTAKEICENPEEIQIREGLREMNVGQWENLTFQEIRSRFPLEYEARGRAIGTCAPPDGESFYQAGIRFGNCLKEIRKSETGNLLIVAHAGVIRGYLCNLLKLPPDKVLELQQPYAGITILLEEQGQLTIHKIGYCPSELMDESEIWRLYVRCNTPEHVIRHMKAVADFLDILAVQIDEKQVKYDWKLLRQAALVHDIARSQKCHAEAGAQILCKEGYEDIANLVREHHSPKIFEDKSSLTLSELLFYADKRVKENQVVTLQERFHDSLKKCLTEEAKEKHDKLYKKARIIEEKIQIERRK